MESDVRPSKYDTKPDSNTRWQYRNNVSNWKEREVTKADIEGHIKNWVGEDRNKGKTRRKYASEKAGTKAKWDNGNEKLRR